MTFLNPLVLLGLIAAGIPLLLHLLNLRKLKTVEFSTLKFIKELQKTQIRRLKLQQLLLLILRTLIIIFAVLAFSRPILNTVVPGLGSHVKSSVLIVLDNSFSLDFSDESGNRMKQAQSAAQQIVSGLKDGDEVVLVCSEDVGSMRKLAFSRNFQLMQEQIQKLHVRPRRAEMGGMLHMASALMLQAQNLNREVYVITDAQKNIFEDQPDSLRLSFNGASFNVIPVGMGAKLSGQNLAVDSLHVLTQIFQREKPVEVEAFVRNTGSDDARGVVVGLSYNSSRVAQRSIDVPAGHVRSVILSAPVQQSGCVRASVELEGDALEMDNKRYFAFILPPLPRVALVGSNESTRFLSAVLSVESGRELAQVQTLSPSAFSSANLDQFDVLMISSALPSSENARIENYVRNGGSVMLFAHEDVDALSTLCRPLGLGELTEARFTVAQPATFGTTDKTHPLFQGVFKGSLDARHMIESPKILRALAAGGGQSIISMQGGSFLAESRIGDGRVLYCAVPPAPGWSTFSMTGLFPTVVFRSIPYLSAREQSATNLNCGSSVNISLPRRYAGGGRFTVVDPAGIETIRDAAALPSGAVLGMGQLNDVGVHIIRTTSGVDVSAVVSNVPSSESHLSAFTKEECVQEFSRRLQPGIEVNMLDAHHALTEVVARARTGTELWKFLVVMALCCALAEMLVARRSASIAAST